MHKHEYAEDKNETKIHILIDLFVRHTVGKMVSF